MPQVKDRGTIENIGSSQSPRLLVNGLLHQCPYTKTGYQRWVTSKIQLDFVNGGLTAEWKVRIKQSDIDDYHFTGWKASFIDHHGHRYLVCVAKDKVILHAGNPDAKPTTVPFTRLEGERLHFRFIVSDKQGSLYLNGQNINSETLGKPNSPKARYNRVDFGDGSNESGSHTEMEAFYYTNEPNAKTPIKSYQPHPPLVQIQSEWAPVSY